MMNMSLLEIRMLATAMAESKTYLEYGSGHSTLLALRKPAILSITSVDSNAEYVARRLESCRDVQDAKLAGRLRFLTPDIGPAGRWGQPLDSSKSHLWPNYALCPYHDKLFPDLVLIDGRFRIACGLAAALQAPEALVLIHDYSLRSTYHVLERFFDIVRKSDTMVGLRRAKSFDADEARRLLKKYIYIPE
jgi:hypothetical protein